MMKVTVKQKQRILRTYEMLMGFKTRMANFNGLYLVPNEEFDRQIHERGRAVITLDAGEHVLIAEEMMPNGPAPLREIIGEYEAV